MITLIYDDYNGATLPEGSIQEFVNNLIISYKSTDVDFKYSQDLFLYYFRLAIREKRLNPESIILKYKSEVTKFTSDGRLEKYIVPDYTCEILSKL